ncbi:MAG: MMPL family transporter, partial [Actinomycetota bacterium]
MSHALYRMGRFAARRPLLVLLTWLVAAATVIGASATAGAEMEDSFEVPGLDSQAAVDLLSSAQSERAGLTAQLVLTPLAEDVTFFDSAEAMAAVADVQAGAAALPNVLGVTDAAGALAAGPEAAMQSGAVSPDGRIALIRVQYPVIEDLSVEDLDRLKEFGDEAR